MDNKNVVFGRVIKGMQYVLEIEKLDVVNERPVEQPVHILKSGVFTV